MWTRFVAKWNWVERFVATILLIIAIGITVLEVVSRSFFGYSFFWAQEIILYCVVWSVFLGASQAMGRNRHVKVSLVIQRFSPSIQRYIGTVTACVGGVFCVLLTLGGAGLVSEAYATGVRSLSLLKIPLWIPYLIIPIAGMLFTLRFFELILKNLLSVDEMSEGR